MAVMIGYLANFALPRLGEVSRCLSLKQTENIPFEKSFGTVITERIADLIAMIIVIILTLFLSFKDIQALLFPNFNLEENKNILFIGLCISLILTIFIYLILKKKLNTLEKLKQIPIIGKFIHGISEGLFSILKLKKTGKFVLLSTLIWICYYFGTFFLFKAFETINSFDGIVVLTCFTMGTVGMLIPTQGGIGSYHGLVASCLSFYGIAQADSFALATFFHGTQMVTVLLVGSISLIFTLFIKSPDVNNIQKNS